MTGWIVRNDDEGPGRWKDAQGNTILDPALGRWRDPDCNMTHAEVEEVKEARGAPRHTHPATRTPPHAPRSALTHRAPPPMRPKVAAPIRPI